MKRLPVKLVVAVSVVVAMGARVRGDEPPSAGRDVRQRLQEAVEYLAAPDMEGRGPGTKGIDRAADWLATGFREAGLDVGVAAGSPFQSFAMTLEAKLGPASENRAELVGPVAVDGSSKLVRLELGRDYTPLAAGGGGEFDLPLMFAGYGITAPKERYDDYASVDPKGKAVVILRHEPRQDDPASVFEGNQDSQYAALSRKIANASEHEVGGVVFVNDFVGVEKMKKAAAAHGVKEGAAGSDFDEDALMAFGRAGDGSDRRTMPVLHVRRSAIDPIVKESFKQSLEEVEKRIDDRFAPSSGPLAGWRIRGRIAIDRTETVGRNVIAVLPGKGPRASEVVVLGAHYDHLGYGGSSSLSPGAQAIHHGADDNASGTAMLMEAARALAKAGPASRTILFVAFSGEERGLLGSGHFTANPTVPLENIVAMVNLDMVGRLDKDKLVVHGTGTGSGLEQLIDRLLSARSLKAAKEPGGFGPSDHASFYAKKIPVLHFFTGSHGDYHRPSDTADKINYDGMVRITELVVELVRSLAEAEQRPAYVEIASKQFARGGDRPYFGSIPDFGKPQKGYAISGVAKDSPAARGGLAAGDVIVRIGGSAITGLDDFDSALRKHKGGDTVPVVVLRDGAEVKLDVTLAAPR